MNNEHGEELSPEMQPERPLECGECRKPIAYRYTEVVGKAITRTSMCATCPELQRRLKGVPAKLSEEKTQEGVAGLACGNCGTSLKTVRIGGTLGCNECYTVFDDILLPEMLATGKIPPRLATAKKNAPIHIGRSPGEAQEITPSLRLLALNEALSETLKREDYEQAALLRDQIRALTEENPEKKNGKKQ